MMLVFIIAHVGVTTLVVVVKAKEGCHGWHATWRGQWSTAKWITNTDVYQKKQDLEIEFSKNTKK